MKTFLLTLNDGETQSVEADRYFEHKHWVVFQEGNNPVAVYDKNSLLMVDSLIKSVACADGQAGQTQ